MTRKRRPSRAPSVTAMARSRSRCPRPPGRGRCDWSSASITRATGRARQRICSAASQISHWTTATPTIRRTTSCASTCRSHPPPRPCGVGRHSARARGRGGASLHAAGGRRRRPGGAQRAAVSHARRGRPLAAGRQPGPRVARRTGAARSGQGGRVHVADGRPTRIVAATPTRVRGEAGWQAGPLSGTTRFAYDYDGMQTITLDLASTETGSTTGGSTTPAAATGTRSSRFPAASTCCSSTTRRCSRPSPTASTGTTFAAGELRTLRGGRDRPRIGDECDEPDVATTPRACKRKLLPHPGQTCGPGFFARWHGSGVGRMSRISARRIPTGRGIAPLADIPFCPGP